MKASKNQVICIKLFSFVMFLVLLTGCVERPLLLRNRPNVPPPSLDPESDEIPVGVSPGVVGGPAVIIDAEKDVPPVAITEIKSVPLTHKVKKGESFWKIARMYGVTNAELATCNNLPLDKPLKVDTVLVIPPGGVANYTSPPKKIVSTPKPKGQQKNKKNRPKKSSNSIATGNDGTYTVQAGDSLWKIARRANVSTKDLISANGLDARRPLKIGQKLIIPGVSTTAPKKKKAKIIKKEKAVIEEKIDPIDDLLNDAEKAAGETGSTDDPTDVITGLDKAAAATDVPLADDLYTEEVLPNETLQEIAERHGLKVEDILKVNPDLKPNQKLKPFTSIKIPSKKY